MPNRLQATKLTLPVPSPLEKNIGQYSSISWTSLCLGCQKKLNLVGQVISVTK